MIAEFFIKGLLIGIIFGIPAGAIGALTIQRTIDRGFRAGFITGMGSSLADLIYSVIGVFGNTVISVFLTEYRGGIQCIGGLVVIAFGISILLKKTAADVKQDTKTGLVFCFFSAFGMAMMNPAMILSFMVAFSTFGIGRGTTLWQGSALLLGILVGTVVWWGALSGVVAVFRNRITDRIYRMLNLILGSCLLVFGVGMIVKVLLPYIL